MNGLTRLHNSLFSKHFEGSPRLHRMSSNATSTITMKDKVILKTAHVVIVHGRDIASLPGSAPRSSHCKGRVSCESFIVVALAGRITC